MNNFLDDRVTVEVGDITQQSVDAVVNAANSTLLGGGGVDGAIHSKGGDSILQQCREIRKTQFPNGLPTGKAVITTGGNLAARFVIHTVGPIYGQHGGNEAGLLADCYRNCLALAVAENLKTIAFPSISTGAFAYPQHEAAKISSQTVKDFLLKSSSLDNVKLLFFDNSALKMFLKHHKF